MSKFKIISLLSSELAKLNQEIDLKIIKGLSYEKEARRHRTLLSQLKRLQRESFWSKSLQYLSLF